MTDKPLLLWMIAETDLHPGSGQAQAVIDLPVAREEPKGVPYIAGSSLKGALRQAARETLQARLDRDDRDEGQDDGPGTDNPMSDVEKAAHKLINDLFGQHDQAAGAWMVGDARLLAIPMRSLQQPVLWVTSPMVLRHVCQDLRRVGADLAAVNWAQTFQGVVDDRAYAIAGAEKALVIEELRFTRKAMADNHAAVLKKVFETVASGSGMGDCLENLLILSDDHFGWLMRHGLPIRARVALDKVSKRVQKGALWYQEVVPTDSIFYSVLAPRHGAKLRDRGDESLSEGLKQALAPTRGYLQVGGDATVGLGWVRMQCEALGLSLTGVGS